MSNRPHAARYPLGGGYIPGEKSPLQACEEAPLKQLHAPPVRDVTGTM